MSSYRALAIDLAFLRQQRQRKKLQWLITYFVLGFRTVRMSVIADPVFLLHPVFLIHLTPSNGGTGLAGKIFSHADLNIRGDQLSAMARELSCISLVTLAAQSRYSRSVST